MYNKKYFIDKFSDIDDEDIGESLKKKCALHHCGIEKVDGKYVYTEESEALGKLLSKHGDSSTVYKINDGLIKGYGYTPKERILNCLKGIYNPI